MAALACPAVHMLGCAPNFPSCRASAYGCLARRMLPMAVLPSPDCTVENFAWREIGERSIDFSFWRGSCNRAPGKLKFAGFSGYVRHLLRHFPRHFFSHCFRHLFRHLFRHIYRHWYRHIYIHSWGHSFGHLWGHFWGHLYRHFSRHLFSRCAPPFSPPLKTPLPTSGTVNCGVLSGVTMVDVSYSIC